MLRLVDSAFVEEEAQKVVAALHEGKRLALRAGPVSTPVLAAAVSHLGEPFAIAQVPTALDQVPRTVLELSLAASPDRVRAIDDALRDPDGWDTSLELLDEALRGRRVVVERLDHFAAREGDEIANALTEPRRRLVAWLLDRADVVTSHSPLPRWGGTHYTCASRAPTVALRNGDARDAVARWEDFDDAETFALALQLEALEGTGTDEDPTFSRGWDADAMRARLWDVLPEELTALLRSLAVLGRPVPSSIIPRIPGYQAGGFERGIELALWRERGETVAVDPAWTAWCGRSLPRAELRDCGRSLAETFAREVRPEDPSAQRSGIIVLEAFRLLVELGEVDRAMAYARHGVELLAGYARDLSRERRYAEAAAVYERLAASSIEMPKRLRGYVRHYLHYNQAHARPELEPVIETARGYESSLSEWPENAIFWSRTVRAWFLADQPVHARECLARAREEVPAHRDKGARLIARTARRLIELGYPLDAIEVLGDYQPDTERAVEDLRHLVERLDAGWTAERLELPGVPPLVLHRPERFRIVQQSGGWRLLADRLGRSARCATPIESARDFVKTLSEAVRSALRAYDRDLDEEERARKHTLLSMIDVIASGLDAPGAPTAWVYGTLERDAHGALWLVPGGNLSGRYEVPSTLAEALTVGDQSYLAEVLAGPSGVPLGPVQRLEPLPRMSRDEVWRAWRERLKG